MSADKTLSRAGSLPQDMSRTRNLARTHMKNDNLRADRDDLDDFIPRAPAKREKSLVLQVATGVFLGGLALWLVQLAATAAYAKLMLGTITFGS